MSKEAFGLPFSFLDQGKSEYVRAITVLVSIAFFATHYPNGKGQETQELASKLDSVIVLRFGGDCVLAEHYERYAGDDTGLAFHEFTLLQTADISMVNLESPVTTRGERVRKPFNFRTHPRYLRVLKEAGFDLVNIANNHIFDYGEVGLYDTIAYLDSAGIGHVGAGKNKFEARKPFVAAISGKSIAFLGYYEGGEAPSATPRRPGVAKRKIELIRSDIRALKQSHSADFIVVNLHWGIEKADRPERWQIKFARQVIDAGADAVIGHHPHVLQGIEKYKSGVIVYSLGNLIFGGNSRSTYTTGLFEIRLTNRGPDYRFIPVIVENWKARELIGHEADDVLEAVKNLSRQFPASIFHE